MARIEPFAALRPRPDVARRVCELPYDVMSSEEARQLAEGNPLSFLRVSKPEIELPPGTGLYSPEVYARGRDNFRKLMAEGVLRRDPTPCFYFYRQQAGAHRQTGLVAVASCEDYLQGVIRKHELTRPDKEDDRVRHIEALDAQTGPAFLAYRADAAMAEITARVTAAPPDIDFEAADGIRHASWVVSDAETIVQVKARFAAMPRLYIADGHHRSAAAGRVFQSRKGAGGSAHFLSVIFPHDALRILPYNRVLKDLNGQTPGRLLERLQAVCTIRDPGAATPAGKHEMGLCLEGRWLGLSFRPGLVPAHDPFEALDVTLLQKHVLAPIFGIEDPRTSQRIQFVGGVRGTAELEKLVRSGEAACAFSMFPTGMEDLMAIADAGGIMPPKSTWFEPKLRDAMFCHLLS